MKQISYVAYSRGQLDNPDVFSLNLFSGLQLTRHTVEMMDLDFGDKIIISKDETGHYHIGKANSPLDPEAWPIDWQTDKGGVVARVKIDRWSEGHSRPYLDVNISKKAIKGYDQNGIVKLHQIERP